MFKALAALFAVASAGGALAAGPAAGAGSDAPAKEPPRVLSVGTDGVLKIGVLLQGWYVYQQVDAAGGSIISNTFRVRRAEINVQGDIVPDLIGYRMGFDPSRLFEPVDTVVPVTGPGGGTVTVKQFPGAGSIFQDLFVTLKTPYADVSVGQLLIPVSLEGYGPSEALLLPERALVASAYGDKRDLGIRASKAFKYWSYTAGVFNGAGANGLDNDDSKDLALRLEAYPIDGLTLGAVGYASIGNRLSASTKDRWELDARYLKGPFTAQGEYIRARDGGGASEVDSHGFYGEIAYKITDAFQPAVRVGYLDPNLARDLDPTVDNSDEAWEFNAGVNYYLKGLQAKMQLGYTRIQYDVKAPVNQVILGTQVWF